MPTKNRKLAKAAAKAATEGGIGAPIIDATKAGKEAATAKAASSKNPPRTEVNELKSLDKAGISKTAKVVLTAKVKDEKGNIVNPKTMGSAARARFDLYGKGGGTVAEYAHKGVKSEDFRWDRAHNFIELVEG